jgi:ribosomal protein S18 acetylase RimI-like enzyme
VKDATRADDLTIRDAGPDDVPQIRELAVSNRMFAADELDGIDEALQGYLGGTAAGHRWLVAVRPDGWVGGAAYFAPEPFADRVWNLYFLAVDPGTHRLGIGRRLVAAVERVLRDARERSARVLIVETSGTPAYSAARALYEAAGFDWEARIREFYGPGDDKIVFWKSLLT